MWAYVGLKWKGQFPSSVAFWSSSVGLLRGEVRDNKRIVFNPKLNDFKPGVFTCRFFGQNSAFSPGPVTASPSAFGVNVFYHAHFDVSFLFVPFLAPNDHQRPAVSSWRIPPPHLSTEQWATASHIKSHPISELRGERLFHVNAIYRRRRSRALPHHVVNHVCPPPHLFPLGWAEINNNLKCVQTDPRGASKPTSFRVPLTGTTV